MANRFLVVCGGSGYKLLGQRTILGVDAELQIDVTKENVSRNWKVTDKRSLYVDLDERVGTTAVVFERMLDEYSSSKSVTNPDLAHAKFISEHFTASRPLEYGLNQSPAVGKATISHPLNRQAIELKIRDMITNFGRDIGPENPVEVWIISSTAGGTGEGTHRFVARKIAEFMKTNHPETSVSLNFIRIGQATYRAINLHRTALNTFMGVAADAAFMLKIKEDFPQAVTNWFYLDLPDVAKVIGLSVCVVRLLRWLVRQ
jgi:hypothetical protein